MKFNTDLNLEQERDTRFVELGRYLCEVRAGQYWRVDNMKSFDEISGEEVPRVSTKSLLPDGHPRAVAQANPPRPQTTRLDQGQRASQGGSLRRTEFRLCTLGAQGTNYAEGRIQARSGSLPDGQGNRTLRTALFQGLQESDPRD